MDYYNIFMDNFINNYFGGAFMITNINSTVIYISESGNDGYLGYMPVPDGFGGGPIRGIPRLLEMIHTMRSSGVMHPISVRFIQS